jgi:hypothetical protein
LAFFKLFALNGTRPPIAAAPLSVWQVEHRLLRNCVLPFATLPLDPPLVELEELLDEDELLVDELLLDELDELLPVGVPDDVLPPPQPTRRMQPASTPPVTLSNLLILYILLQPQVVGYRLIISAIRFPAG